MTNLTLLQALLLGIGALLSLSLLYQDLRQRTVHIYLLVGLFAAGTAFHLSPPSSQDQLPQYDQFDHLTQLYPTLLQDLAANLIFITTILGVAYIYMRIRHKSPKAFQNQIGLGDILYFIAAAPWFTPIQYILFFTTGILVTLATVLTLLLLRKIPKDWPIPLAGLLAAYSILFFPLAQSFEY